MQYLSRLSGVDLGKLKSLKIKAKKNRSRKIKKVKSSNHKTMIDFIANVLEIINELYPDYRKPIRKIIVRYFFDRRNKTLELISFLAKNNISPEFFKMRILKYHSKKSILLRDLRICAFILWQAKDVVFRSRDLSD